MWKKQYTEKQARSQPASPQASNIRQRETTRNDNDPYELVWHGVKRTGLKQIEQDRARQVAQQGKSPRRQQDQQDICEAQLQHEGQRGGPCAPGLR